MLAAGHVDGAGLEREVVNPVEVTEVVEVLFGPQTAQDIDELCAAAVALVVFEPRLAKADEFVLEPSGDDIDSRAATGDVVGRDDPFGQHGGVPQSGVNGGDDLQPFGLREQPEREARRFVLLVGAVRRGVADLAQRVVEAVVLGELGDLDVEVEGPVGALLDRARDETAGDVGHPVGELQRIC